MCDTLSYSLSGIKDMRIAAREQNSVDKNSYHCGVRFLEGSTLQIKKSNNEVEMKLY